MTQTTKAVTKCRTCMGSGNDPVASWYAAKSPCSNCKGTGKVELEAPRPEDVQWFYDNEPDKPCTDQHLYAMYHDSYIRKFGGRPDKDITNKDAIEFLDWAQPFTYPVIRMHCTKCWHEWDQVGPNDDGCDNCGSSGYPLDEEQYNLAHDIMMEERAERKNG